MLFVQLCDTMMMATHLDSFVDRDPLLYDCWRLSAADHSRPVARQSRCFVASNRLCVCGWCRLQLLTIRAKQLELKNLANYHRVNTKLTFNVVSWPSFLGVRRRILQVQRELCVVVVHSVRWVLRVAVVEWSRLRLEMRESNEKWISIYWTSTNRLKISDYAIF